jgi:hypothetical protein
MVGFNEPMTSDDLAPLSDMSSCGGARSVDLLRERIRLFAQPTGAGRDMRC